MSQRRRWGAVIVLGCAVGACSARQAGAAPDDGAKAKTPTRAKAEILSKSASTVTGSATFVASPKGVTLEVALAGAEPGVHAVHIHMNGDCSAADGTSAGDHWNPTHEAHGAWGAGAFHLGDIGNITVDAEGRGTLSLTTDRWSIGTGGPNDIVHRAVIVHAKPDDFTTQPTGAAGPRIGCGVIEAE